MKASSITYPTEKRSLYRLLKTQLQGLADGVTDLTANLANISALLNQALTDINWVGFYIMKNGRLVLGPFQGKPACTEIPVGSGVCGTAAARDEIMLVKNVHEFPGHIACDSVSQSEIVIPIHKGADIIGVLDIDSPMIGRFDGEDQEGLSELMQTLEDLVNDGKEDVLKVSAEDHAKDRTEVLTEGSAKDRMEILTEGPAKDRLEILNDRIKKFIDDRNWDSSRTPSNLAKSISIEAAELLECFQWDDEEYNRKHVLEELADVMNYCIQMSQVLNVDIVDTIHSKMKITEKKYPIDEVKEIGKDES